MRTFVVLIFLVSSQLYAQTSAKAITGHWKISVIDNGIFKMEMDKPGQVVHRMLEEEREEGETMTEADSLKMLGDVKSIYGQFSNLFLKFKKNGKVQYNLGSKTGEDALKATDSKGTYHWQEKDIIVIKSEAGTTDTLKVVTLTKDNLEIVLADGRDRNVVFLFKK